MGTIYISLYCVVFLVDLGLFVSRNVRLFNYTLFTVVIRIIVGTVSMLYLSIQIDGFFLYFRRN